MNQVAIPTKGKLSNSWLPILGEVLNSQPLQELKQFLQQQKAEGKAIYPASHDIFNAFNLTPFDDVKVVIIGQDPYHQPGQAHGLSFSVRDGVRIPPSLRNIFAEQNRDLGLSNGTSGDLTPWAIQGVLLLNAVLTVEESQPASHQNRGWEILTDKAVQALSNQREHLVFLCWGAYAQRKVQLVDRSKHLVLTSVHPSPLSAHRGFIGNQHFSKTNDYLNKNGLGAINWQLKVTD